MEKKKFLKIFIVIFLIAVGVFTINKIRYKVKSQNSIIVGICCGEPPYEYLDKDGNIAGINKKLLDQTFKDMKIDKQIVWKVLPFSESFLTLDKGKIDMLATFLHINEERKKRYDFAVISSSQLVFVGKTGVPKNKICYGLQSEALFEKEAKEQKVNYKGFANAQDVFLNFQMNKVTGMVIDKKTLKDLLKNNFTNITSPEKIQIKIIKKDNEELLQITNNFIKNKFLGMVTQYKLPTISDYSKRLYYYLNDLILAFRTRELNTIVLSMGLLEGYSCFTAVIKDKKLKNKLFLNMQINKYGFIFTNSKINNNSDVYGILENDIDLKKISAMDKNYKIKRYNNFDTLIKDLNDGQIKGLICLKNFPNKMKLYCEFANIITNGSMMQNGFAFRKNNLNKFDKNIKAKMMMAIENSSENCVELCDYKECNKFNITQNQPTPTEKKANNK